MSVTVSVSVSECQCECASCWPAATSSVPAWPVWPLLPVLSVRKAGHPGLTGGHCTMHSQCVGEGRGETWCGTWIVVRDSLGEGICESL